MTHSFKKKKNLGEANFIGYEKWVQSTSRLLNRKKTGIFLTTEPKNLGNSRNRQTCRKNLLNFNKIRSLKQKRTIYQFWVFHTKITFRNIH